ncbi:MAG: hypothetical protein EWM47_11215 [Anaerolineaceae bacterium]|nr:MAG: hypothetical protein EWM47_11215 [Anaerolineaceae bacterium]
MAFWNIRYLLVPDEYQDLGERLKNEMGFRVSEDKREGNVLYISDEPSAYYLTDSRNALVISTGTQGFSAQFPNFVQGKSSDILDYTEEELLEYKLIYIIEPEINTLTRKNNIETMVTKLVNNGVTVMIEPLANKVFDLFGVHVNDEELKETIKIKTNIENPYDITDTIIKNNSNLNKVRSIYYLDEIYANYEVSGSDISIGLIGAKNVGEGKLIFVGAHLSQYLDMVYTRNNGLHAYSDLIKENSDRVEALYSDMFSYYGVNENYMPTVFDSVTEHKWDYNGGSFTYESEEAQEVTISVTYTPRWSASLDGQEIAVGQRENLITLELPAGRHTVELHYGMTSYGKIGYIISAFGIILFLIVLLFWDKVIRLSDRIAIAIGNYLQINNDTISMERGSDSLVDTFEEVAISDELETAEAITAEAKLFEEDMIKSIQYRTVNENDIKVDIIVIDSEPNPDSTLEIDDLLALTDMESNNPDGVTEEKKPLEKVETEKSQTKQVVKLAPKKNHINNKPKSASKTGKKRGKKPTLLQFRRRKRYIRKTKKRVN